MTSKRNGRRWVSALAALVLAGSVLAVAAGPAQAANTASEVLTEDGDREFGGRDRYDTALQLAESFAEAKGGLGAVPTAFLASGSTLVDAVSVAGYAGFLDAPVLLTASDYLHGGVADFIEDYGVDTIYVLGGPAAIADSVVEDLEALANEPTVERIEGSTRYGTAVEIASELGVGSSWCDGDDPAAILVNGGDVSLADAMLVGPIAYRLQVPVLLTAADELPPETSDFITDEDIEHVVIVGGTRVVSKAVKDALEDAGVDTVERIAGATAAATSVALAELMAGDCADALSPVSVDTAALVNSNALPDGIVSAPVLASTFAEGALVPVLLVGDTLPASVQDYLTATPSEHDGRKVDYKIVAIGGAAVVSEHVMDAAVAAAASAESLTVKIGGIQDTNEDGVVDAADVPLPEDESVILYFSDDVGGDGLESKLRDIIFVNGVPASFASDEAVVHAGSDDACNPDQVTVAFTHDLRAGDTISLVESDLQFGSGGDARTLASASLTVKAPAADRARPTIEVIMIATRTTAEAMISEDGEALEAEDVTLRSSNTDQGIEGVSGNVITFDEPLTAGDRVTIARGAAEDEAGNQSLQRSFTAAAPQKSPRITSVLMSNPKHTAQAMTTVPDDISGSGDTNVITIKAKADGDAAGAAGNVWSFSFDVASTWDAEADVDIEVSVSARDNTVFVRFANGAAKFGDLKDALESTRFFADNFEIQLPANMAEGCDATRDEALSLDAADRQVSEGLMTGGMTQVAIEVRFNGYAQTVDSSELLDDLLADTANRGGEDVTVAIVSGALAITDTADKAANSAPTTIFRYEATTGDAAMLPLPRDLVSTEAGRVADLSADPPVTAVEPVATGYADDDDKTSKVNEELNAASQVRIGRSSNVEAPEAPSS